MSIAAAFSLALALAACKPETGLAPQVPEKPAPVWTLKSKETLELGSFELSSPRLAVGDPGYDEETIRRPDLGAILVGRPGRWLARSVVKEFDSPKETRNSELIAWHSSAGPPENLTWEERKDAIAVDSGQAGFFDLAHFEDDSVVPKDMKWGGSGPILPHRPWYSLCADVTLSTKGAGTIPFGAVSSAGMGDGFYQLSVARNKIDEVVGVRLIFLDDQGRG